MIERHKIPMGHKQLKTGTRCKKYSRLVPIVSKRLVRTGLGLDTAQVCMLFQFSGLALSLRLIDLISLHAYLYLLRYELVTPLCIRKVKI